MSTNPLDERLTRIRALLAEGKARAANLELAGLGEEKVVTDPRLLALRIWARLEGHDEMHAAYDLLRLIDTVGLDKLPEDIGPAGIAGVLRAFGPEGKRALGGAIGKWAVARKVALDVTEKLLVNFPLTDWPAEILVAAIERDVATNKIESTTRARLEQAVRVLPGNARVRALYDKIVGTPEERAKRIADEQRARAMGKPISLSDVEEAFGVTLPRTFAQTWMRAGAKFFRMNMGELERMRAISKKVSPPDLKLLPFAGTDDDVYALEVSRPRPGDADFAVLRVRGEKIDLLAPTTKVWLEAGGLG